MSVDVHRTDDDALMIDLQAGRREAFDELVARHQGALIGFFFRNTRDAQLSEDLAQETLLRVYNQAWDYLPRGTFRGWMFRIARNLLIDNSRRRSHDALVKAVRSSPADREDDRLSRVVDDITAPVVKADQKELADLVEKLLYNIPEEQRLTFLLHHFAGLSLPEVADALETNVPTAKSRLRLAREKLRDQLAERGVTATMIAEEEP
ncbi:MAG: sigma-70 family RNA polymerase sigma factor [Planctomycetaceae bacterium]|nr:sigma-70 family RNA polymerase sigma factor [Planctomycetaceae bacterium]